MKEDPKVGWKSGDFFRRGLFPAGAVAASPARHSRIIRVPYETGNRRRGTILSPELYT